MTFWWWDCFFCFLWRKKRYRERKIKRQSVQTRSPVYIYMQMYLIYIYGMHILLQRSLPRQAPRWNCQFQRAAVFGMWNTLQHVVTHCCTHLYVCIYIYVHVCVHVYIYTYVCIYHIQKPHIILPRNRACWYRMLIGSSRWQWIIITWLIRLNVISIMFRESHHDKQTILLWSDHLATIPLVPMFKFL